jgi:hypothetical protein
VVDDGLGELGGGAGAADVPGAHLLLVQHVADGRRDLVCEAGEAEVAQHHHRADQDGGGVGGVLPRQLQPGVRHALREQRVVLADAGAGGHADAPGDAGSDVGDDAAVEVGRDHDVELRGVLDQLHGAVVDDHLLVLDEGELFGGVAGALQEEPVDQLHDVGLVDDGDLLAAGEVGELEGVLEEAVGVGARGDLERLHDSGVDLVLDARELALDVLADDCDVDVVVAVVDGGEGVAEVDVGEEVEVLVELVVVVVLGVHALLRHHHAQQDALVLLQQLPLLPVLEREVLYYVELHRHVRSLEHVQHALCIPPILLVISGPIPMPEMRVTLWASPKLGLCSSALYQVALWPRWKRLVLLNNLISTLALFNLLHSKSQLSSG